MTQSERPTVHKPFRGNPSSGSAINVPDPLKIYLDTNFLGISQSLSRLSQKSLSALHEATVSAFNGDPGPKEARRLFAGLLAIRKEKNRRHRLSINDALDRPKDG